MSERLDGKKQLEEMLNQPLPVSNTPRTDKWEYEQECNYEVAWEDNCRQLERELAEITKQRDELLQAIEGYDTTEVNDPKWQRRVKNAVDNCRRGK